MLLVMAAVNVWVHLGPRRAHLVTGPLAAVALLLVARAAGLSWAELGLGRGAAGPRRLVRGRRRRPGGRRVRGRAGGPRHPRGLPGHPLPGRDGVRRSTPPSWPSRWPRSSSRRWRSAACCGGCSRTTTAPPGRPPCRRSSSDCGTCCPRSPRRGPTRRCSGPAGGRRRLLLTVARHGRVHDRRRRRVRRAAPAQRQPAGAGRAALGDERARGPRRGPGLGDQPEVTFGGGSNSCSRAVSRSLAGRPRWRPAARDWRAGRRPR